MKRENKEDTNSNIFLLKVIGASLVTVLIILVLAISFKTVICYMDYEPMVIDIGDGIKERISYYDRALELFFYVFPLFGALTGFYFGISIQEGKISKKDREIKDITKENMHQEIKLQDIENKAKEELDKEFSTLSKNFNQRDTLNEILHIINRK